MRVSRQRVAQASARAVVRVAVSAPNGVTAVKLVITRARNGALHTAATPSPARSQRTGAAPRDDSCHAATRAPPSTTVAAAVSARPRRRRGARSS